MMTCEDILQKDWYNILGANPSESLQELKQKYQKLALLYHPDKQSPDVPAGELEKRVQRFIDVDQAWKILGNEETKKQYDLQRRGRSLPRNTLFLEYSITNAIGKRKMCYIFISPPKNICLCFCLVSLSYSGACRCIS
ncbi:UNVERIFIED_CONTAM: hypothetical protein FKN15_005611 [Acipenser sinensis]